MVTVRFRDDHFIRRIMRNRRRARHDNAGPCPGSLLRHERQLLGHPQVPERDGRRIAAVAFNAPPLCFGHVGLDPYDRVDQIHQLIARRPRTFDDHQFAAVRNFDHQPAGQQLPGHRQPREPGRGRGDQRPCMRPDPCPDPCDLGQGGLVGQFQGASHRRVGWPGAQHFRLMGQQRESLMLVAPSAIATAMLTSATPPSTAGDFPARASAGPSPAVSPHRSASLRSSTAPACPISPSADPVRSLLTSLPPGLEFRTKGQLATGIIGDALADGVVLDFACGDEVYGSSTQLREFLEDAGLAYVLRIPSNFRVTLAGGMTLTCAEVVRQLGSDLRWEVRSAGNGSKGQRWYAWAWLGTASWRHHLLIRRHVRTASWPSHYCFVPGGQPVSLSLLVRAAGMR